ncbi:hypothetical protein ADUPG1_013887 [Aduncisulcus paluster]|uniref:Uncharacterized protein n=2 Tax=Aduncisulcus paluster TaxID=2918883 RepID=A0ABQ5K7U7_9EUKA|nr:hypothetical protein ADUPG1_013887 [Aduncisulcus paluster]
MNTSSYSLSDLPRFLGIIDHHVNNFSTHSKNLAELPIHVRHLAKHFLRCEEVSMHDSEAFDGSFSVPKETIHNENAFLTKSYEQFSTYVEGEIVGDIERFAKEYKTRSTELKKEFTNRLERAIHSMGDVERCQDKYDKHFGKRKRLVKQYSEEIEESKKSGPDKIPTCTRLLTHIREEQEKSHFWGEEYRKAFADCEHHRVALLNDMKTLYSSIESLESDRVTSLSCVLQRFYGALKDLYSHIGESINAIAVSLEHPTVNPEVALEGVCKEAQEKVVHDGITPSDTLERTDKAVKQGAQFKSKFTAPAIRLAAQQCTATPTKTREAITIAEKNTIANSKTPITSRHDADRTAEIRRQRDDAVHATREAMDRYSPAQSPGIHEPGDEEGERHSDEDEEEYQLRTAKRTSYVNRAKSLVHHHLEPKDLDDETVDTLKKEEKRQNTLVEKKKERAETKVDMKRAEALQKVEDKYDKKREKALKHAEKSGKHQTEHQLREREREIKKNKSKDKKLTKKSHVYGNRSDIEGREQKDKRDTGRLEDAEESMEEKKTEEEHVEEHIEEEAEKAEGTSAKIESVEIIGASEEEDEAAGISGGV